MSQFNPQGGGFKQQPPGQMYQPYQPVQQPQRSSGGGNTLLIVLAIVGGLLVLGLGACGVMAYMVTSSMNKVFDEFSDVAAFAMAEELVTQYEDSEEVVSRIGEVENFDFPEKENKNFLEILQSRKIVIVLEGKDGTGELILYKKNQRPERVVFVHNGEEILLDDDPKGLDDWQDEDWSEEDWADETDGEETGPGFGEEEFSDPESTPSDTSTEGDAATQGDTAAEGDRQDDQ